jgi:hypothetical protein
VGPFKIVGVLVSCDDVETATSNCGRFSYSMQHVRLPLWSSGQSSWLQIRRPGFDSRHYQKKNLVSLERCPFSLVSTTEELLDRKVAAPV